ncbi:MAG: Cu(I)-responsive transcriptional regulator [Pseudomonadota bacterium]|nr:Cu(I)-responsive transcriptional regulator [Pseudomonadota bacterium]
MNIGQAAKISGLTVKTVRYYDNIGLVKAYQNSDNQYRVYSQDDIAKLQFIGRARRVGFSIYECRELLSLYQDKNRPSREVKELTLEKLAKIDNKLDELRNLRNQLYHLSKSCSGDDRPDCPILDALASEN